ncbi:hypothetical protein [Candidatus Absconditicoccus praedator]|uniref:hypothetical protein n=1 Tax=Candidatus Absconditicoccus praedator TaxID=2735562 RepID=UPI001E37BE53|nr:hypothetical protein [Candidatus Absconditicoccus praedator]UFX82542.1 hypothetical protein HLG78_00110 [Candidatus Absconditicoccus praedator]
MASLGILQKYLSEDLLDFAQTFDIGDDIVESMPNIIELILRSKSIDKKEEKQNWIDLLSVMTEEQISKLEDILTREREKLQEIEKKYEQKKMDIKKKYLAKWQQMGYVKKVAQIHEQEKQEKTKDDEEAEELLSKI